MNKPFLIPAEETRSRNPLFFVLAVLSGLPTAFFGLVYANGQSTIAGILLLWSFMWVSVWWKMSDRYR